MDRFPWPPEPPTRLRGRPKTYSERLIMKALVIMIVRRLYTASALLAFLDHDDAVAAAYGPSCANTAACRPAARGNAAWPRGRRACPG
jgi:hypothetical protein